MGTVASRGGVTSVHNNESWEHAGSLLPIYCNMPAVDLSKFGSNPECSFVLSGEDLSDNRINHGRH